jgi:SAM-dependent methyltransferase
MNHETTLKQYSDLMVRQGDAKDVRRLHFYLDHLFSGVQLAGARVLDIGCGTGFLSFYAACQGAKQVVCLEPESAGSTAGVQQQFESTSRALGVSERVLFFPTTFQEFEWTGDGFDVVLLHNSINHLNEECCIHLLDRPEARKTYAELFQKLAMLCKPGGTLIVCDVSPRNFFAAMRVTNPSARSIEWHKHQTPEIWSRLLAEQGFSDPGVRWTSPSKLGHLGQVIFGNRLGAYFFSSHFCLKMRRK